MDRKRPGPQPRRPQATKITANVETVLLEEFDHYFAYRKLPRNQLLEQAMRHMLNEARARDRQRFTEGGTHAIS